MIQLKVDPTHKRPLRTDVFDWLYLLYPGDRGFPEPPPIPRADKKGNVGINSTETHCNPRSDKGRFLMLGIEPPLNLSPYLSTNEVRRLQIASQRVPKEHWSVVAEVGRHVNWEGSIDGKIISRLQPLNNLCGCAVSGSSKHQRQSGAGDGALAKRAGGHHAPSQPVSHGRKTRSGVIAGSLARQAATRSERQSWPCRWRLGLGDWYLARNEIVLWSMGDGDNKSDLYCLYCITFGT